MLKFILKRLGIGVFILFGVSVITFFLPAIYESPASLALSVLGHNHINRYDINLWLKQNGFDHPLIVRYWNWLWAALHGNFGISYIKSTRYHEVPVTTVLGGNLLRSVYLVTIPTIASILIAIPIGLSQAVRRNKLYDHLMTTFVYVLYSTPAILVCLLMAYYFAIVWNFGQVSVSSDALGVSPGAFPSYAFHNFSYFILPIIAIILLSIGGLTRYMRGSALDTLVQDYVRTAKAKGAGPTRVLFRHVMRPSLIPLITILGLSLPGIIGGALIVEAIFNYPGMGVLTVQSVETGDFAVVLAITLFTAFLTVAGNLLADIFVAVADPRIRLNQVNR